MGKWTILSLDGGELPNLDLDVRLPLDLGDLLRLLDLGFSLDTSEHSIYVPFIVL